MAAGSGPSPEVALASLAILKVNWDTHQRDYIGNFVPFAAECLRELSSEEVSLQELRELVFEKWGLAIPNGPMRTIMARAAKEGLVEVGQGVYVRLERALQQPSIAPARDRVMREQAELVNKLRGFCLERHGVEWSEEAGEAALLEYASEFAGPILGAALDGRPLPREKESAAAGYLVNSFVIHLHEGDAVGFESLESVVKGSMLANALYYPDLGAISQRLTGVEVFFDTRVVLEALVGNDYERRARKELFDLVYELGGQPKLFEDTERELRAVLDNEARSLRRGTVGDRHFGVLTQRLIDRGLEASDLELIIARLPRLLGTFEDYGSSAAGSRQVTNSR
jgi:hypothetical protein